MNRGLLLQLLHVGTAMVFVAGLVGRSASFRRAGQTHDIGVVAALLHLSDWFERALVVPVYFAVLLTGVLAALAGGWPLWRAVTDGGPKWPVVSLILFLSPWLVIPTYLAPRRRRRGRALADALLQQKVTAELAAALHDRGVLVLRQAELVMTAVVLVLMLAKPF